MRTIPMLAMLIAITLLSGCVTTGSQTTESDQPVKLKHDQDEVPAAVRAIETQIDRRGAIMAEEVEIYVSKNYEWDVALTGDDVSPPQPDAGGGTISIAEGHPRATFRNLEIRAWKRIVFRRSDLNVVPFIHITAKGRAAHATTVAGTSAPMIKRAPVIRIRNADIEYLDAPGRSAIATTVDAGAPAGVGPAPRRMRD